RSNAAQNDPYRVGEEMHRVVIFNEAGILCKKATFFQVFDVRFERQLPVLTSHLEQLIQHTEQLEILRLRDRGAGQHLGERLQVWMITLRGVEISTAPRAAPMMMTISAGWMSPPTSPPSMR